jgi:hypothetical protein
MGPRASLDPVMKRKMLLLADIKFKLTSPWRVSLQLHSFYKFRMFTCTLHLDSAPQIL